MATELHTTPTPQESSPGGDTPVTRLRHRIVDDEVVIIGEGVGITATAIRVQMPEARRFGRCLLADLARLSEDDPPDATDAREPTPSDPVLALVPQIEAAVIRLEQAGDNGGSRGGDIPPAFNTVEALREEALDLTPTTPAGALLQLQLAASLADTAARGSTQEIRDDASEYVESAIRHALRLLGAEQDSAIHDYFVGSLAESGEAAHG